MKVQKKLFIEKAEEALVQIKSKQYDIDIYDLGIKQFTRLVYSYALVEKI